MSNAIERLEALAEKFKPGTEPPMIGEGYDDWWHEFTQFRRTALDALPALLRMARAAGELPMNEPTNLAEWQQAVREFRAFKTAVEPLFREVPE